MTRMKTRSLAAVLAGAILTGAVVVGTPAQADTLTIGTAPSLRAAFHEIVPMFEKEYGVKVQVVYGPSQTQRRKIEQRAPIDVFFPAAIEEVEKLEAKGMTLNGGPRAYAQTSLVLVMSAASRAIAVSLRDVQPNRATRIAMGDPKTSALGEITTQAFARLDPAYKTHFHLLQAQHAEDVVNLVHTGAADMGIIYRADAIKSGQVRIIDEAPVGVHTPIRLGGAVVWTCRDASLKAAEEFMDFIVSPRIQKLMLKYGFDAVPSNG